MDFFQIVFHGLAFGLATLIFSVPAGIAVAIIRTC